MDNRNDLNWRPEDWQHTLGQLRRAEHWVFLKTWGAGIAVVGTIATGAAFWLNQAPPIPPVETTRNEVQLSEARIGEASNHAVFIAEDSEVITLEESLGFGEGEQSISNESTPSLASNEAEREFASEGVVPKDRVLLDTPDGFEQATEINGSTTEDVELVLLTTTVREHQRVRPLPSILGALSDIREKGNLMPMNRLESTTILPNRSMIPLRISYEMVSQTVLLEIPREITHVGSVRLEGVIGLGLTSEEVAWSAWHPGTTMGASDELKRVHTQRGLLTQGTLGVMYPIGHRLAAGITATLQYDLARRLDVGTWNADAFEWASLESSGEWGLVTEYNPVKWHAGLRIDWSVAPEWLLLGQFGPVEHSSAQMESVGISSEGFSPWWFKIGIQR
jgi:hypothetical protein